MFQQHGLASLQLAAFSLAALVDLRLMKLSLLSQPPQKLRRGFTVFGAVTTGLLYMYPPALNGWREMVVLGFQLLFRVGLVTPRIPLWRAKRLLSASLAFDAFGFGGRCIAPMSELSRGHAAATLAAAVVALVAGELCLRRIFRRAVEGKSALDASLRRRGENSYYYAHGGGSGAAASTPSPRLLEKSTTLTPQKSGPRSIEKYSFVDEGLKVKVYIELAVQELSDADVALDWEASSLRLQVNIGAGYVLHVPELQGHIEGCTVKVKPVKKMVILTLKKLQQSGSGAAEWTKLAKERTIAHDDGICIDGR